ncbi:VOC family protein [Oceanobacillus piezotolerans]|uniref:VOC family protein n=1 Tax=Oceanobacillus piezotolerans TaxID=2448030 RepID=A0A498D750_9BACI|nr:VOC family protein [Oceanobacillus piezotolerans]RLL41333.1 VOC family protein [Oceanobacillus piezotolerans]
MIKGINHKGFHVVDMERSLDFYCNKLGFKKAFELNQPSGEPWIVYVKVADGCFIELFYGGTEGVKNRAEHICFEVDDIQETAEQLKKRGVPLEVDISQGLALNYQFWVKDPDGNWIEFMEMNPDSPHMRS